MATKFLSAEDDPFNERPMAVRRRVLLVRSDRTTAGGGAQCHGCAKPSDDAARSSSLGPASAGTTGLWLSVTTFVKKKTVGAWSQGTLQRSCEGCEPHARIGYEANLSILTRHGSGSPTR